jgi:hypothetical protein
MSLNWPPLKKSSALEIARKDSHAYFQQLGAEKLNDDFFNGGQFKDLE